MTMSMLKAAAFSAVLAATGAFGQGGPGYGAGQGYGPMRGGHDQGFGPGAGGGIAALNLSHDLHEKIVAMQEDHRRKNWDTMGQVRSEMFRQFRSFGPWWLQDEAE